LDDNAKSPHASHKTWSPFAATERFDCCDFGQELAFVVVVVVVVVVIIIIIIIVVADCTPCTATMDRVLLLSLSKIRSQARQAPNLK
jgi:hypothetical protein